MKGDRYQLARETYENGALSLNQISALMNITALALERRARREKWQKPLANRAGLTRRTLRYMQGRLERFEADEAAGVKLTAPQQKSRSDETMKIHSALSRPGVQGEDDRADRRMKNDDVAAALDRVERKIIELAEGYAGHMVASGAWRLGEEAAAGGASGADAGMAG